MARIRNDITPEQRHQIAAEYAAGATTVELAKKYRIGTPAARNIVLAAGVPMRSAKEAARRRQATIQPAQQQAMVADYAAGMTAVRVAEKYRSDRNTVTRLAKGAGVAVRVKNKGATAAAEAAARYASGVSANRIARAMKCSVGFVLNAARANGVTIRPPEERHTMHTLNEAAFDVETDEAAYWVGMLITDGNVSRRGHYVSLGLQERDRAHVEAFRRFLGSSHKISRTPARTNRQGKRSGPQVRLSVASRRLCSALGRYGVVPAKTHSAQVVGLEWSAAFWRGAVDGDGWVSVTKNGYPQIGLVGSRQLTTQFLDFIRGLCPECRATVRSIKTIFGVMLTGRFARRVIEALYGAGGVALGRKRATAARILAHPGPRLLENVRGAPTVAA